MGGGGGAEASPHFGPNVFVLNVKLSATQGHSTSLLIGHPPFGSWIHPWILLVITHQFQSLKHVNSPTDLDL